MTDFIGNPPLNSALPVAEDLAQWSKPWGNWFSKAQVILFATSQSGPTAERPTKNLYVGRTYFDTSLGANGKPIWMNKGLTGWVLADGTAA